MRIIFPLPQGSKCDLLQDRSHSGLWRCSSSPESLQGYHRCKTEKIFREDTIQGVSFGKDENFFIFDHEASTVTFYNKTFAYGHIITVVDTISILSLQGNTE
jgi:hypothetical protein